MEWALEPDCHDRFNVHMSYLSDCLTLLGESRRHFHDTGTILPSSRFLGRALAAELAGPRPPATILEAGPGTGPATRQILRHLGPDDRLDLVEINPRLVASLEQTFESNPEFQPFRKQVRIIQSPIEQVTGHEVYDFIVCGLPFNNFSPGLVREIFRTFRRLLKPGGVLSYFEYAYVRHLKVPFCSRSEKRRLYRVGRVVGKYISAHELRHASVFLNVPPAIVRYLRLKPQVNK